MLNPNFIKYKDLYSLNELSFQTKYDIINSNYIQKILPPYPSFQDKRNTKGAENYARYCNQANYVSYPNICLDAVIGIVNRKVPNLIVPRNMNTIADFATKEGTSIITVQNKIIESIFKFGLAGILVEIPENVSIATSNPKLKVIQGNKIVDYQYFTNEKGESKLEFITFDTSRYVYNKTSKSYAYTKLYQVHSLNEEGKYTITELLAYAYSTFDHKRPVLTDGVVSIIVPSWAEELNFIPFTPISKLDCSITFGPSFIQDLIDISLQNFRLEANLCWLEANAAASHLVIKGRNLDDCSKYPIGAGAIHVLNDENAQEYYVTPSTAGMAEIKSHILENCSLANELMYNLTNVASNSSGESLKIRINSKLQDLVGLIKVIALGLTLSLEQIDEIMNNGINKNNIEYIPYLGFANIKEFIGENE